MPKSIEFEHITKVFPGQKALDDVSFSVEKGEIHAIIGENGAGKSTLLKILHGVHQATSGVVRIDGEPVKFSNTSDAIKYGIAIVHQEIVSIPDMTVAENLFAGKEPGRFGFVDKKKMNEETARILGRLKSDIKPTDLMSSLSTGQKQMVSIAKALEVNAKIISFDEPTSSLSDAEVEVLFEIIRELKEKGITVLYISHKMNEIFSICDHASVLRDGQYITTLDMKTASRDDMIHAMVGRDVAMFATRTIESQAKMDDVVLDVQDLSGLAYKNVSFQLHRGEILGFFGLIGAGRTEVMRGIFGADKVFGGAVKLNGKQLHCSSPNKAISNGIALISENRKEEGVVPNMDNQDNMALPCLNKFIDGIFVNNHKKRVNAVEKGTAVGLKPNLPEFMTMSLSGGNAQKVMLARWMSTDAEVMIFDEPTKGIDIGAKSEIYRLMENMAQEGKAIIMVSSELTEVIGMSDRIIVMREGEVTATLEREEFSEDRVMNFAVDA